MNEHHAALDAAPVAKGRGPGRPRTTEPMVPVTTWVREREYDRLCRLANQNDVKVSSLIRSLLILRLP
jgi:hypothetical protein